MRQAKPGRGGSDIDTVQQSGNLSEGTRQVESCPAKAGDVVEQGYPEPDALAWLELAREAGMSARFTLSGDFLPQEEKDLRRFSVHESPDIQFPP